MPPSHELSDAAPLPQRSRAASDPATVGARSLEDLRAPAVWLTLGLVIEQASHGYELSRRYDERFGDLVPRSVQRVYAALDGLREDGLIEVVPLQQQGDVPKRHLMRRSYRATQAGVEAYRDWLLEQMSQEPLRDQLIARLSSVAGLSAEWMLELIERYAQICLEQLREVGAGDDPSEAGVDGLVGLLLADQQRRELRARYDWAVHARGILQAHVAAERPEDRQSDG